MIVHVWDNEWRYSLFIRNRAILCRHCRGCMQKTIVGTERDLNLNVTQKTIVRIECDLNLNVTQKTELSVI